MPAGGLGDTTHPRSVEISCNSEVKVLSFQHFPNIVGCVLLQKYMSWILNTLLVSVRKICVESGGHLCRWR